MIGSSIIRLFKSVNFKLNFMIINKVIEVKIIIYKGRGLIIIMEAITKKEGNSIFIRG